ncbi:hypothetical protein D6861_010565 [Macrococcoides caseolyticum]|nr:hypothetical protein [Macrococcus caseolyticus]RKO13288.1 hypothetical protein D6861_10185 [Macrococcus caseolyticus]
MNYKELDNKYKKLGKLSNEKKEIERILIDKYKAFEIPLYSIDEEDYTNDDEVNEKYIYKLFHINNSNVLNEIIDKSEIDIEDYHPELLDKFDYDSLIMKHNSGKGVSIVLETKDGKNVSNFKVYGMASRLVSHLVCHIPFENLKFKINNPSYQYYLECLRENNFI